MKAEFETFCCMTNKLAVNDLLLLELVVGSTVIEIVAQTGHQQTHDFQVCQQLQQAPSLKTHQVNGKSECMACSSS